MNRHFFHIKVNDGSKAYNPETQTVLDISTALNFFSLDPAKTRQVVGAKVRHLTTSWNEKSKGKGPTVIDGFNFLYNTCFIIFFCQKNKRINQFIFIIRLL